MPNDSVGRERFRRRGRCLARCWCALLLLGLADAKADDLEGQSAGNTNWIKLTVQGWHELDQVPVRIILTGGPVTGRVITLNFNHVQSSIPQIEALTGFAPSGNVVMTTQPVLSAPPGGDVWSYSFTVDLRTTTAGNIDFFARLSAGSHLASSSLVHFGTRTLQIEPPATVAGSPDISLVKSGPATCQPGSVITYTLRYTNSSAFNATGVQVTDILPGEVTFYGGDAAGPGFQLGDTLTWDLGTLWPGASGVLTYQVQVGAGVPASQSFGSTAMILSAENDASFANNSSAITTTVQAAQAPAITSNPAGITNLPGNPVVFTVAASGGSVNFQWRKNGAAVAGATGSSYGIAVSADADVGYYDVLATNACGATTSSVAPLVLCQPLTGGLMLPDHTFRINATSISNQAYAMQYSSDLTHWQTAETGRMTGGAPWQWLDCGPPETECPPAAANARFYRLLLLP